MPGAPEAKIRARAGAIGFPGAAADTPVAKLSGGEKSRLLLALACFEGPHLVVLDEPTNHLDIDSRAALIEAINGFAGAVILVSHDRYLLEACADRLWLVQNGGVAPFEGDLDDYRRLVLATADDEGQDGASKSDERRSRTETRRAAAERRAELAPLKRRITALETEMAKLGKRVGEIDQALADPKLYENDPARAAKLAKERADAAGALAGAEEQWLELSGKYESASAAP
jgi:ATP-binding cassette subfamily F protein 3